VHTRASKAFLVKLKIKYFPTQTVVFTDKWYEMKEKCSLVSLIFYEKLHSSSKIGTQFDRDKVLSWFNSSVLLGVDYNTTFKSFNFGKCPKIQLEHHSFHSKWPILLTKLPFDRNYLSVINIVFKNIPIIGRSKFNCIGSFFRITMLSNSNLLSRKEMRER